MFRRLFIVMPLMFASLLLATGAALADDYVPPGATSGGVGPSSGIKVLGTSQSVSGAALSYTGTGFNVGGAVLIGAIVVLVGIGLCVAGAKMLRGRSKHS